MKHLLRIISYGLILLLAAGLLLCPVWGAEGNLDYSRRGSLSVTLRSIETLEPLKDVSLMLYCVALAEPDGYNLGYEKTAAFRDFGGDITDFDNRNLTVQLLDYIQREQVDVCSLVSADAEGTVRFEDLPLGLYLVVQAGRSYGYSAAEPFLASVPMTDPVTGQWVYEVDASPKVGVVIEPTPTPPPPPELPKTGMLLWPIPVLALAGLALFVSGLLLRRREKDES